jgi:phage regulator Rha-like protein
MNQMMVGSNTATMSSLEISELVGSRHDSVKRTIDRLVERSIITQSPLVDESRKDGSGRTVVTVVYRVTKRDSFVVVAQLCPEFTAALVDRWQELEARHCPKSVALPSYAEALRGLADQIEQTALATAQLAIAAPKAEALDLLCDLDGSLCFRDAAKSLGWPPNAYLEWMRANRWIYKPSPSGEYKAYQPRIASGLMCVKITTLSRDGKPDKLVEQARVTAKGLAKQAQIIGQRP